MLVAIIFFISGLSLPPRSLWERSLDWRLHAATQISSFLLFPTITFAIASFIRLADPNFTRFDPYAIVGMVVLGVIPTTVSSNVVMTGQAGGDQSAATIEVMLGNLLGTFLSPALLQMFLTSNKWSFGKPVASGGGGTGELYRQVIEQLGFSVFIPLFVGEVIQWIWPKQVKWFRTTFRVAKIGTLCLLGVIWSTFSTAFAAGAFQILSWETVVMLVVSGAQCTVRRTKSGRPGSLLRSRPFPAVCQLPPVWILFGLLVRVGAVGADPAVLWPPKGRHRPPLLARDHRRPPLLRRRQRHGTRWTVSCL